ncbi:MAG TPA: isoamylase [Terriglobia bacterium]|nr:isoamylase [Terriglobia bacterium]
MNTWFAAEGSPSPLGVTWIEAEQAFNFALYSKDATSVTLLLYGPGDVTLPVFTHAFDPLTNKSGRVWHCRLEAVSFLGATYYAYQVAGRNAPGQGQRFDDQKILFDPYAMALFRPEGFSRAAACVPGSNAGKAPLGVIAPKNAFDWSGDAPPVHTSDTVIYEVHVRGFTERPSSGVAPEKRGTYAGLIEKIPYLQELGITAVELLPVFQQDSQEGSYWGYMPLSFFSPNHSYAIAGSSENVLSEFRSMVKALHAAGIEVILDVVFNHTAEGDENGPTYSYCGIDNSTYYVLAPDMIHYRNDTGTGNTLRCANRYVRQMIVDSLRFWKREMHVDGFRFDLASIFSRYEDGSINLDDPPVIAEISGAPALRQARLIAEAWDLASYELGRTFPGISWLQWNGQFRDNLRSFVKGDAGMVPALITRVYGSSDLFPDDVLNAYHPYQSVNFVTCHDGFCLYDLVSYNQKHNEANGENNEDGTDDNLSWNCGWEGDENVPADVVALRKRQAKNFCCLLLLSNGTPMFPAGDEFLNTQQGNNNPYNQDNEITWLDWDLLRKNQDHFRFFKTMIAFRKAHPSLGRSRFWRDDVRWYGVGGAPDLSYDSHTLAFCLHGASQNDKDLYVMINAYWEELTFGVQEGSPGDWRRVVDTSLDSPDDICEPGAEIPLGSPSYAVGPRSIVVLIRK